MHVSIYRISGIAACMIIASLAVQTHAYPHPVLPQDPNTTQHQQFATVVNPHYGLHVFATGTNGSLYHMWQTSDPSDGGFANMSDWHCLTPNDIYASSGYVRPVWWWDPAAVVNTDGHIDVFIRLFCDKNLWQLYQKDPKDPQSFTAPRGPTCLCNFPPCAGQTKCGLAAQCDNKGVDCTKADPSVSWNDHAPFPTSNMNAIRDPKDGTVRVYFRGFNGQFFENHQVVPGNSTKYTGGTIFDGVFE